ncbi:hypothetical protein ACQR0Z_21510 [Bradyrhizobium sp. HKCCYLS3077]|uniref:hypothetical protein n=1 Tax=Bradyrhizobium sp. HKCCYLS3077 TaxID=3420761 RepID=UPI003EBE56F8
MEPAQKPMKERDRALKAWRDELIEVERREIEFRRHDRRQRAAELGLPLDYPATTRTN